MRVVLIDGNNVLWRIYHAAGLNRDATAHGIVQSIAKVYREFPWGKLIVFWDGGKSAWRSRLYPKYKAERQEKQKDVNTEELFRQSELAQTYLSWFGVRQIKVQGVEADDLLAWFSSYLRDCGYEVAISSTDKDLWQLVDDPRVVVYDHAKGRQIGSEEVLNVFGVDPPRVADIKALTGDASDSIPGVKGIGQKTAESILSDFGSVGDLFADVPYEQLSKSKRTAVIYDNAEEIGVWYRLVRLSDYNALRYLLDDRQRDDLVACLDVELKVDEVGRTVATERIGSMAQIPPDASFLDKEVLEGIKRFAGREEAVYGSLEELDAAIAGCVRCPLRGCCGDYGPTLPAGYSDVQIMVIGRNPGGDELVGGEPFIGRAGKRLDKFLEAVGLTRRDVWITNTCKCYSESNRPPTHAEIMACSDYIRAEIALIKPRLILTFGNEAMSVVTPYGSGVTHHSGEILENPTSLLLQTRIDAHVAIAVHPSSALRSPKYETELTYASDSVRRFLEQLVERNK